MIRDLIEKRLRETFQPESLAVIDESHLHAGHAGARPGGETHFRVRMTATAFEGVTRLRRQREVLAILQDQLDGPVHALALRLKAPSEDPSETTF